MSYIHHWMISWGSISTLNGLKYCWVSSLRKLTKHEFNQLKVIYMSLEMVRCQSQTIIWQTVGITWPWFEVTLIQICPVLFYFLAVGMI